MGSMRVSNTDKVCRALENMGYLHVESRITNFIVYKDLKSGEMYFVGMRGNVRRGFSLETAYSLKPTFVASLIEKHYKSEETHA